MSGWSDFICVTQSCIFCLYAAGSTDASSARAIPANPVITPMEQTNMRIAFMIN